MIKSEKCIMDYDTKTKLIQSKRQVIANLGEAAKLGCGEKAIVKKNQSSTS